MSVPEGLRYTRSDEWARIDGDVVTIGITDYAQHELGEIVYVELPEVGALLKAGAPFGVVESVKAVAELISPIAGEVVEVNETLLNEPPPPLINDSPFEEGWMVKVKAPETALLGDLLDAAAYQQYRYK